MAASNKDMTTFFDPLKNYEIHLKEMKHKFEQKWQTETTSSVDGLEGFTELAILGSGYFGDVKLLRNENTSSVYAVKVLSKDVIINTKQEVTVFNEKKVLQCVDFPFLMYLEFLSKDKDNIYFGLPFMSGGTLFKYLRRQKRFSEDQARFYAAQVFLGFEYLHNVNVLYGNLRPQNIMIDSQGFIKIIDFSLAKKAHPHTASFCDAAEYLAPEIIFCRPYGTSADWWTFGIFIYEMVNGTSPFAIYNYDLMTMYDKICAADYDMNANFSPELKHLIQNLLQVNVLLRYGYLTNDSKDIKEHEWFKSINWYSLLNKEAHSFYIPQIKDDDDVSHFSFEETNDSSSTNQSDGFFKNLTKKFPFIVKLMVVFNIFSNIKIFVKKITDFYKRRIVTIFK